MLVREKYSANAYYIDPVDQTVELWNKGTGEWRMLNRTELDAKAMMESMYETMRGLACGRLEQVPESEQ